MTRLELMTEKKRERIARDLRIIREYEALIKMGAMTTQAKQIVANSFKVSFGTICNVIKANEDGKYNQYRR